MIFVIVIVSWSSDIDDWPMAATWCNTRCLICTYDDNIPHTNAYYFIYVFHWGVFIMVDIVAYIDFPTYYSKPYSETKYT